MERWKTYTGVILSTSTVQSDANGDITISVADLDDDFALKVNIPGTSPDGPPGAPRNLRTIP